MALSFDMFTLLPDDLRSIIVSFLPFKEAARTSILSKRWLHIWKATTNVEFNELFFVKSDQPPHTIEAQRRVFLNFITFWLDNYKEPILDKFSLKLSMPENAREIIERCIAFPIEHGVKELGLDFSDPNWEGEYLKDHEALVELPKHVYGHKTLESLKLFSCRFLENDLLNFDALKEVSLGWMEVTHNAITTLLANCKMIESLSLKRCWNSDQFDIGGENLGLRRLVVDKCHFQNALFKINAPNLIFFKYSGLMSLFDIEVFPLVMEEAELDFDLEFENDGLAFFLYNLVEDLCPVRVLTVCSYILQVLPTGEEPQRIQCDLNVRHLIMRTGLQNNELLGVSFFLNSCPMLECLTMELGFGRTLEDDEPLLYFDYQRFWLENIRVYQCLRSTLKVVEMKHFKMSFKNLLVLHYFIRCGRVLKKININLAKEEVAGDHSGNLMELHRTMEEFMLGITRASSDLEISIC